MPQFQIASSSFRKLIKAVKTVKWLNTSIKDSKNINQLSGIKLLNSGLFVILYADKVRQVLNLNKR